MPKLTRPAEDPNRFTGQDRAGRFRFGLAVLSGLLMTAAFPNVGLHWTAWGGLVPLLFVTVRQPPMESFRLGILAGLVHNVTLMYWLAYTVHTYGHLPWLLSVPIMLLLAFYLSLFWGAFCAVLAAAGKRPVIHFLLVPFLWVFLEYLRSFLLSGFPWALLGHSQSENLMLIQISDVTGVYGLSFFIASVNGLLFALLRRWPGADDPRKKMTAVWLAAAAAMVLVMAGGILAYGHLRIKQVRAEIGRAPRTTVIAVQGNIDQALKWDRRFQAATVKKYIHLSLSAAPGREDLVVWPETAAPFYFTEAATPFSRSLNRMVMDGVTRAGCDFLIGSPSFSVEKEGVVYYNSAYLVRPGGRIAGKYDKVHLVPFGEYVPFKKWLPFLGKIVAHVGDFNSGKKGQTLSRGRNRMGVLICFEIIFPELSRAAVQNGASMLVNMTNDAWYGRTGAPYQHFSMAVFRAVENRRSLVRSANTGISGFIDPTGQAHGRTPLYEEAAPSFSVPLIDEKTFYTRHGDLFAQWCAGLAVVLAAVGGRLFRPATRS